MSVHYSLTIKRWHDNWIRNRETIVRVYGERWYRLWNIFLAWSWRIGLQGTSACFQVVAHKNSNDFNRRVFIGSPALSGSSGGRPPEKDETPRERYVASNGTAHAE